MPATRENTYITPLCIPEGTSGTVSVVHDIRPTGSPVIAGTFRTLIFRGQPNQSYKYDAPTRWHKLVCSDRGTWMTDWPVEQIQIDEELAGLRGRVLVGGLGLGYAATVLARRPEVKEVVVVEINADVVKLVAPYTPGPGPYQDRATRQPYHARGLGRGAGKVTVVTADLFEYLRACPAGRFDSAFFDIWQCDSEETFFMTICPLRDLARGKVAADPVCWNERAMRGQLQLALQNRLLLVTHPEHLPAGRPAKMPQPWEEMAPGTFKHYDPIWHNWCVPFWRWWQARRPGEELFAEAVRDYAELYGRWDWRKAWVTYCDTLDPGEV